jgi:glycosyltransferase involved in cell wall biosynthesis
VLHIHAADFDQLFCFQSKIINIYLQLVWKAVDLIITVSDEWQRIVSSVLSNNQIITLRNCIDVATFSGSLEKDSDSRAKALFLGSIGPRKGVFDLFKAIQILKNQGEPLQVWVAGYEESEGEYVKARDCLKEMQILDSCEFIGKTIGPDKDELLRKANIFILPSYHEGLPMALLEAMAAGLAIVSTDVGGIPEVVSDGYNGFLFSPGDIIGMAEKLKILVRDSSLRVLMGSRSYEIVRQEFDVAPYVKQLIKIYDNLAAE